MFRAKQIRFIDYTKFSKLQQGMFRISIVVPPSLRVFPWRGKKKGKEERMNRENHGECFDA